MQQPSHVSMRGVVDLAARKAAAESAAKAAASGGGSSPAAVIEVTELNFETEVLLRSRTVPVVLDFWADWCGPCKQLSPILEKLAAEADGRWVLGKIDVDANQQLAQAFRVQGIPSVIAVLAEQLVPLFTGAVPEPQVRSAMEQLVAAAQQVIPGYTGEAGAAGPADPDGPPAEAPAAPEDERYEAAYRALEAGDLDGAADAYRKMLADAPADRDAQAGLAQVELLRRTAETDHEAILKAASAPPDDVSAQCLAADGDLLAGRVSEAFTRLVEAVRLTSGEDREAARRRLLELFEIVGSGDPRVAKARAALTSVLF